MNQTPYSLLTDLEPVRVARVFPGAGDGVAQSQGDDEGQAQGGLSHHCQKWYTAYSV